MRRFTLDIKKKNSHNGLKICRHGIFADGFEIKNNRIIFYEWYTSIFSPGILRNDVGSFIISGDDIVSYEVTSSTVNMLRSKIEQEMSKNEFT